MPRSVKRNVSRKRNPKYNTKKRKLTKKIGSQKGGLGFKGLKKGSKTKTVRTAIMPGRVVGPIYLPSKNNPIYEKIQEIRKKGTKKGNKGNKGTKKGNKSKEKKENKIKKLYNTSNYTKRAKRKKKILKMLDRNLRKNKNISYLRNIDSNVAKDLLQKVKSHGVQGKNKKYLEKIENMLNKIEPIYNKLPINVIRRLKRIKQQNILNQQEQNKLYLTPTSVRSSTRKYEYGEVVNPKTGMKNTNAIYAELNDPYAYIEPFYSSVAAPKK